MSDEAVSRAAPGGGTAEARAAFEAVLRELRPKLHRYCARMTGSVIDGEDVLQDTFMKAIEAFERMPSIERPENWLFRIAHNTALDFLRRRRRQEGVPFDEDLDMIADPAAAADRRQIASTALHTFMHLPVTQRSSVILMDVLGYSLNEIGGIVGGSVPAIKAALHRGRTRLRELAELPDDRPLPVLSGTERARLAAYVERFNARDFDAVRDMLAEDVRLDLVSRSRLDGRSSVGRYFTNYERLQDWHMVPGFVDRRPAVLVRDPRDASGAPTYFVLLEWGEGRLVHIRDFYHARYATEGAELIVAG
jgi:RNA polymerase sigma-70 factor, ECF subfamily